MSTPKTEMLIGRGPESVVVKISGPATMAIGPRFTALCEHCRDVYHQPILVDLSTCEWLDSTFAGCLLGQSAKSRDDGDVGFRLAAPSAGCRDALTKLGVAKLLIDDQAVVPVPSTFTPVSEDGLPAESMAEIVVEAHDRLADVNESNRRTFGPIAQALRDDMERKRNRDS